MINLTDSAQEKLANIVSSYNEPDLKVRMYVSGGGCSGMQYGFEITNEQNEDDWEFSASNTKLLIDPISMQYIEGITVDWLDDLMGARFVMNNPKAQTTCGCGSSFSPY